MRPPSPAPALAAALALGAAAIILLGGAAAAQAPLIPRAVLHRHQIVPPVAPDHALPILSGASAVSAPVAGSAATRGPLAPRLSRSPQPAFSPLGLSPALVVFGGWTFAGPDGIFGNNGAIYAASQTASGRVTGIAVDPTDADTFYVAAAGGGVWKTTDGGASYVPLTDFLGDTAMGSIAVAPSDHDTVYAGTGEASFSADSKYGIGLLKSTDGGTSWSVIPGPDDAFYRHSISKIVVDPTNAATVYLTVTYASNGFLGNSGVWKSTDGGLNWANTTALAGLESSNPYTDLVINPAHPQTLYASVGYVYGAGTNGVYKTTDGGATWALLGGGLPTSGVGRISLALAASAPQTLYASIAKTTGAGAGLLGLYKTTDGGATWAKQAAAPDYLGGQGWYDNAVVVSPTNANMVFAGGVVNYNAQSYGDLRALVGSLDGGATFYDYGVGAQYLGPHTDLHALTFTADGGKLLDGNDGGVWRLENPSVVPIIQPADGSADVGNVQWTDLNTNLDTTQFTGIALDPTDRKTAYGGSQDNGTEKTTGTLPWITIRDGDGGFTRVDQSSPQTVYHEYYGISLERSDDGGLDWNGATTGINHSDPQPADGSDPSAFYVPFKLDPADQSRVIYATNHVYESLNRGDNFVAIGSPGVHGFNPNANAVATTVGVAGPIATLPGAVYVSANARLYATFNDGAAWADVTVPGVNANLSDIYVNPLNPADVIVARGKFGGGKVFRSTTGGAAWADITSNLPDEPFNAVLVDKRSGVLYAGGDDGVYSSLNFGASWSKISAGLPTVQVVDLALTDATGILAAGTHGRGMWTLPLSRVVAKPNVSFASAFTRVGGVLTLRLTLRNSGTANTPAGVGAADALNAVVTHVTVNGVAGAGAGAVPVVPAYGQAAPLTYTFPGVGAGKGVLSIAGTYTGGGFGGTLHILAP